MYAQNAEKEENLEDYTRVFQIGMLFLERRRRLYIC